MFIRLKNPYSIIFLLLCLEAASQQSQRPNETNQNSCFDSTIKSNLSLEMPNTTTLQHNIVYRQQNMVEMNFEGANLNEPIRLKSFDWGSNSSLVIKLKIIVLSGINKIKFQVNCFDSTPIQIQPLKLYFIAVKQYQKYVFFDVYPNQSSGSLKVFTDVCRDLKQQNEQKCDGNIQNLALNNYTCQTETQSLCHSADLILSLQNIQVWLIGGLFLIAFIFPCYCCYTKCIHPPENQQNKNPERQQSKGQTELQDNQVSQQNIQEIQINVGQQTIPRINKSAINQINAQMRQIDIQIYNGF